MCLTLQALVWPLGGSSKNPAITLYDSGAISHRPGLWNSLGVVSLCCLLVETWRVLCCGSSREIRVGHPLLFAHQFQHHAL